MRTRHLIILFFVLSPLGVAAAFPPTPLTERPYSAKSPFNTMIPTAPTVHPNSAKMIARLTSWGEPQSIPVGDENTPQDWSRPIYVAKATDPTYTIRQVDWQNPDIEGRSIHIPLGAKQAGASDASIAIIQPDGWEYSFTGNVRISPNQITASFGRRTRRDGDGLGVWPERGGITEANTALGLGLIREAEMRAGRIDHALAMVVKCHRGNVWPSTNLSDTDHTGCTADAPPMGAHVQLDMTAAQIDALAAPAWQKVILTAMAEYGMYVIDDGGPNASWHVLFESGGQYTSLGRQNPWIQYAKYQRISPTFDSAIDRHAYYFELGSPINWATKLQVLTR